MTNGVFVLSGQKHKIAHLISKLSIITKGEYGAELWLNLQKAYELRLAEELVGEEIQKTIQPRSSINNQPLVQV